MPQTHSHPTMRRSVLAAGTAACLGLSNCTAMLDAYHGKGIGMSGAGVVVDKPFEPYDAAALSTLIAKSSPAGAVGAPDLEGAIGGFTQAVYAGGLPGIQRQNQMRDARNVIQGTLLATSANRCNAFKQILRARSANTNFILGSLATVSGVAGAIVTGGASQALAGVASAASGVGAEYTKDIMSNVTSAVIIPGIDKQRSGILQEIINRRCLGVSSYDLAQAMQDAIRYHSACATDVGVAAASAALSKTNDGHATSMEAASAMLDSVMAMNAKMNGSGAKGAKAKPGAAATSTSGSGGNTPDPVPPADPPAASGGTKNQTTTLVGDQINYLQCPSLDENGMLSGSAVPAAAAGAASGDQVQYGAR